MDAHEKPFFVVQAWQNMGSPREVTAAELAQAVGVPSRGMNRVLTRLGFQPPAKNQRKVKGVLIPNPWTAPDELSAEYSVKEKLLRLGLTANQIDRAWQRANKRTDVLDAAREAIIDREEPIAQRGLITRTIEEVLNEMIDNPPELARMRQGIARVLGKPWLADIRYTNDDFIREVELTRNERDTTKRVMAHQRQGAKV